MIKEKIFYNQKEDIGNFSRKEKSNKYYKNLEGVDSNVFEYLKKVLPKDLSSKKILDLGGGNGRWAEELVKRGAGEVFLIDNSQSMIELAKKMVSERKIENIDVIEGDMNNLPIKDSSVELVLSSFSMMYFEDLDRVINEASRALKDGGEIYITTNIFESSEKIVLEEMSGEKVPVILGIDKKIPLETLVQTLDQYKNALNKAGIETEEIKIFDPVGVAIDPDYKNIKNLELKKILIIGRKMTEK